MSKAPEEKARRLAQQTLPAGAHRAPPTTWIWIFIQEPPSFAGACLALNGERIVVGWAQRLTRAEEALKEV